MQLSSATYTQEELTRIIQGYRKLDRDKAYSNLLRKISNCRKCALAFPEHSDHPLNLLVRPLPLFRLSTTEKIRKYAIRIKRDHTFLRNLFADTTTVDEVLQKIGSAKFSIGLLPWLDHCMLNRSGENTKLMVIGIDYKHFPVFYHNPRDHNFPLDSCRKRSNIWGPTWRRFWTNLLGGSYDIDKVNEFIAEKGVYITNSLLCFGGSESSREHSYDYIECCRDNIADQIRIVCPQIIVSFGNLGCRNVASILLKQNPDNEFLEILGKSFYPLREMKSLVSETRLKDGIEVKYNSYPIVFWPVYQPSRSHLHHYNGDYEILRNLLA